VTADADADRLARIDGTWADETDNKLFDPELLSEAWKELGAQW